MRPPPLPLDTNVAPPAHGSGHHQHRDSDEGSVNSYASGEEAMALNTAQPFNLADASLIASALNSPTRSCVEVNFPNAVFSQNTSFNESAGASGTGSAAATAAAARAHGEGGHVAGGEGEEGRAAGAAATEGGGSEADIASASAHAGANATASAPVVKVNVVPAIIGYFGSAFANGICAFFSQIFRAKGFRPYEIGILAAVNPLLSMTLLPVLAYWADKLRCETKMMNTATILAVVAMFGYTLSNPRYLVIVFFLVMTASRIVMGPLLDQRILMMFPKQGRSSAWSYVRSYAAYGWGLGSLVASLIFKTTESWVAVAMQYMVGNVCLVYCMLVTKPYEKIERVPVRFMEILQLLATNPRVTLFIFAATMMGTGYSFIDNFLFLFLKDLGGSEVLMGMTVVLTVSTEIPLFQMSARLHQIFSERNMMTIAMGVWTFRVVCYSMLTNPWYVLLIEPLHGVTFSFMWLPSMHLLARAFPPKLSSSATGVLFTFTSGVGPTVGNLVAGTLYSLIGPRKMFLFAASVMALALTIYLVADNVLERRGVPIVCDYDAAESAHAEHPHHVPVTIENDVDAPNVTRDDAPSHNDTRKADVTEAEKNTNHTALTAISVSREKEDKNGGRSAELDVVDDELPL